MSKIIPQRIMQRYKALVRIFSARSDITVRFEDNGHPRYIPDRRLIILPNGDFSDPVFSALCEGYIVHEAGHTRYTEMEYYSEALRVHPRLMGLLNLFDDVQMEFNSGCEFSGAKHRLAIMYKLLSEKGWFTPDVATASSEQIIEAYILNQLRQRNLGQVPHEPTWETFSEQALEHMGDLVPVIENAIEKASGVSDTAEAYQHAKDLFELFKDLANENEPEEDSGTPSDEDEHSGGDNESQAGTEPVEGDGSDSERNQESHDGDVQQLSEEPLSDEAKKLLLDYLTSSAELPDYHDLIKDEISRMSAETSDDDKKNYGGPVLDEETKRHMDPSYDELIIYNPDNELIPVTQSELDAISGTARGLASGLNKLLIQRSTVERRTADRGRKFVSNRLVQVSTGITDVFRNEKRVNTKHDVAILSLRDISGSMHLDELYLTARHCEMALARASETIPLLSVANGVYPYYSSFKIEKQFHEKVNDRLVEFGHAASGWSTPTGPAMDHALAYLLNVKASKRILLVTTDGQPDDVSDVAASICKAKALGVIVAGIGVGTEAMDGFDIFEVVQTPSELSRKFSDLVMKLI